MGRRLSTGTSIAISHDDWNKITKPVFFNALGVDPGQGVPDHCLQRFTSFLDLLLENDKNLLSVRNDGATATLEKYCGKSYTSKIITAPDNGFFAKIPPNRSDHFFDTDFVEKYIAINLASDMHEIRFSSFSDGINTFSKQVSESITKLLVSHPNTGVCLFLIYSEISTLFLGYREYS